MKNTISLYNKKRNFKVTKEPYGRKYSINKKLRFVVQHHLAKKDHFDFRLEWDGVLKSWAVPKGPSYIHTDKRLAIMVEDHPLSYRNFEGVIPKGEYGGGTVMLFDEGYWEPLGNLKKDFKNGMIKFILYGERLKGLWTLAHYKDDNWLLIKDKDDHLEYMNINTIKTSIRTGRTMEEIEKNLNKKNRNNRTTIENIDISNPEKIIYEDSNITKMDIIKYYQKISRRMLPFIKNRIVSTVRCPDGIKGTCFYKKHFEKEVEGFCKFELKNKEKEKDDYYFITNIKGLINESQMNSVEFHVWGSKITTLEKPDIMVFDLDPDEKLSLKKLREGVRNLKSILDELNLKAFLKTSGGKGYHVVVPIKNVNWNEFRKIAKKIAVLMESKWPEKYTSNIRKDKRNNKIFIDWIRNIRGATSIAPYSLRARPNAPISFPISWDELDKIKPNEINLKNVMKRLKTKDPWKNFFE